MGQSKNERMLELVELLNKASRSYYQDAQEIMSVELGNLKPGQVRELTEQELKELYGTVKERENAGISRASE